MPLGYWIGFITICLVCFWISFFPYTPLSNTFKFSFPKRKKGKKVISETNLQDCLKELERVLSQYNLTEKEYVIIIAIITEALAKDRIGNIRTDKIPELISQANTGVVLTPGESLLIYSDMVKDLISKNYE